MQTYARIDASGDVIQWPVMLHHIQARGLPMRFFEEVQPRPAPPHNSLTHVASKRWPIRDDAGRLVQAWEVEPRSLGQVRQAQIDALADYRWRKETGGVALPDGGAIDTTREAQAQVSSAFNALSSGMIESVEWKSRLGWVTVTLAEFGLIAGMVAKHVQACFSAERALTLDIEAAETVDDLAALDISGAFDAAYRAAMTA